MVLKNLTEKVKGFVEHHGGSVSIFAGLGLLVSGHAFLKSAGLVENSYSIIPHVEEVQEQSIPSSELSIRYEDKDQDGMKESYMKLGDKEYALRTIDGEPTLCEYEVAPAQIQYGR